MENVIEIQQLIKDFKDVRAVNDLSFKVKKGEFFAFSHLLNYLTDLLKY